jgi:hypothetical protein
VLPREQQQALLNGNASARADIQPLAHVHDQVQHASRLMELGRSAASPDTHVPLCAECVAFVLDDLDGRLRDADEQTQLFARALLEERQRAACEAQEPSVRATARTAHRSPRSRSPSRPIPSLRPPARRRPLIIRASPQSPFPPNPPPPARAPSGAILARARAQDAALEHARASDDEEAAERVLAGLLEQQRDVETQLAKLEADEAALDDGASRFWERWNRAQLAATEHADVELHHAQLLSHCNRELRRLKSTSVLDDVFDIWFDGPFGTLNGLRLGRLPSLQVEWSEINAGLGHAALLVDTLAAAHHLRFPKHTLYLMGSYTKISHEDEPKALLELHGSGSLQLGRIFSGTRFDRALSMFLQCIAALLAHARRSASPSLGEPPYRIEDDKIGTAEQMLSIRLQFNQDELWTRALKYMLTDLKWLLAWHTQFASAKPVQAHPPPR